MNLRASGEASGTRLSDCDCVGATRLSPPDTSELKQKYTILKLHITHKPFYNPVHYTVYLNAI